MQPISQFSKHESHKLFLRFFFLFLHENVGLARDSQLNAADHYSSEVSNLQLEMVYIISTNSSKRYLKRRAWRKTWHFISA